MVETMIEQMAGKTGKSASTKLTAHYKLTKCNSIYFNEICAIDTNQIPWINLMINLYIYIAQEVSANSLFMSFPLIRAHYSVDWIAGWILVAKKVRYSVSLK
jgi:hypothetical protein